MLSASTTADWHHLSEDQQLTVTRAALQLAMHTIAGQADLLADEMERGCLLDRGGPDALRLLATTLRVSAEDDVPCSPGNRVYDFAALPVAGNA